MYECEIRDREAQTCATLSMRGSFDQIPMAFGKVYGWLNAAGHRPEGMPVTVYFNDPSQVSPEDALWEVRAPIETDAQESAPDGQGLGIKRVPAMRVATTVHRGPYEGIGAAYDYLMGWVSEQGLQLVGPPMEAYLNDPSQAAPEDYLTEVMLPVL